jgi:uncharacterized protein (TIGR00255 family)
VAVLLSMTGFGESHHQEDGLAVAVEVRTINSRYFKLAVRAGEAHGALEPRIEAMVRRCVRRGTIQVSLRIQRTGTPEDYKINGEVLGAYRHQLAELRGRWGLPAEEVAWESLLALPGVVETVSEPSDPAADWPVIQRTVKEALESLSAMRAEEGRAMRADLKQNCAAAAKSLDAVARRAPLVADAYRARLTERIQKVLDEHDVVLEPADVIREVGLFAERGDISEEIVRLRSHIEQFEATLGLPESSGRRLEFLTQEMFREANTLGAKANDVEIARDVIEIKAAIERIREMVQNVE